ncbi:hypothetical protein YC2023_042922 [Brassica napus]
MATSGDRKSPPAKSKPSSLPWFPQPSLWATHAAALWPCPHPLCQPMTKVFDRFLNGGRNLAFSPYGEYWRHVKFGMCSVSFVLNSVSTCCSNVQAKWLDLNSNTLLLTIIKNDLDDIVGNN